MNDSEYLYELAKSYAESPVPEYRQHHARLTAIRHAKEFRVIDGSTPISPPFGPATGYSNGLHRESDFFAASNAAVMKQIILLLLEL